MGKKIFSIKIWNEFFLKIKSIRVEQKFSKIKFRPICKLHISWNLPLYNSKIMIRTSCDTIGKFENLNVHFESLGIIMTPWAKVRGPTIHFTLKLMYIWSRTLLQQELYLPAKKNKNTFGSPGISGALARLPENRLYSGADHR